MADNRVATLLDRPIDSARRCSVSVNIVFCGFFLLRTVAADDAAAFYTRYPAYPPYCSIPEEMDTRTIPPLQASKQVGESRILHVSAIFRHGARTPYANSLNCWDDFWTNPATGVWNCKLTSNVVSGTAIYEKTYDALRNPPSLSNALNGTCQLGQLLEQGYEQETRNGQFLRDAYLFDSTSYDHDTRMRLLDVGSPTPWDDVMLRSDDESRTILSGQVVLNGMLSRQLEEFHNSQGSYPIIPLHTADYQRDIVDPNRIACPRLAEIEKKVQQSHGFKLMDQSDENKLLRKFQHEVLKVPQPNQDMHALDCLMTTMCTDRPLPKAIDDYKRNDTGDVIYGSNLFERLRAMNARHYTYTSKANNAEFSKLGMGPLWHEIIQNIYAHIHEDKETPNKIALFSGHDTTIIPLLVSLDPDLWEDDAWPPYASMMLIETHEVNIDRNTDKKVFKSNFAFRLLYNGNVLTSKVKGCSPDLELCDLDILLSRVEPFAVLDRDCGANVSEAQLAAVGASTVELVLLPILGMALGGLFVYFWMTRSLPFRAGPNRIAGEDRDGLVLTKIRGISEFDAGDDDDSLT